MASSEPSLDALQRWFVAATTDPGGLETGIIGAGGGVALSEPSELERVVTRGPRLSALERLAIYHDGYFARLVECLLDDYPALQYLLGNEEFERLARAYIAAHPSQSASLNAYGARMAGFVAKQSEPWAPFAAELAALEWALVTAVHAASQPSLSPAALAEVAPDAWPRARLVPSASLAVLRFTYPVNAYYRAFREGAVARIPRLEASAVAVHREGLSLFRHDLELAAADLLEALARGVPLGIAIAELERAHEAASLSRVQAQLSGWFGGWMSSGFFVRLELFDADEHAVGE
jgi:hypothetical protein